MKLIKKLVVLMVLLLVGIAGAVTYFVLTPNSLPQTPMEFSLKPGSSFTSAMAQMRQAGILKNEWAFVALARVLNKTKQIKYGNYQLEHPVSHVDLLDIITSGRTEQSQLTIVEGQTFKEFRSRLNAHTGLQHDSAALTDVEILKRIGATESIAEGLFFPDTYNFSSGSSDLLVMQRAYQTMQKHLQTSWEKRESGLPLQTAYQALILASIVEKETGKPADRPMIASVFINRLRIGMRLQTDPTVIYGMGEKFDGNIRRNDLTRDTPYNTYTREGLTPSPIALPGLASIEAVLHPAPSNALYFVAKGDGSSHFSESLSEHNNAVRHYLLQK
ncbi:MAG: endolytic transglycosylase MltG [Sideroxydans sp.]|nr:endolytic transglycosylase MltG [Sideroxydans sp.]